MLELAGADGMVGADDEPVMCGAEGAEAGRGMCVGRAGRGRPQEKRSLAKFFRLTARHENAAAPRFELRCYRISSLAANR